MGIFRVAQALPVLGLATRTTSSQGTGFEVGEFLEGELHVLVTNRSGSSPTLRLNWQSSFNGVNGGTGGRYVTHSSVSTYSNATGHKRLALTNFGKWGRLSWTLGGTSPSFRFQGHFVGKI